MINEVPDIRADIRNPRSPFHTNHEVIQAYNLLELDERGSREAAQSRHPQAIRLWLRCINLFHVAFSKEYSFESIEDSESRRGASVRLDLLGLAGSAAKPALDALWAGYYSPAYGMIRGLLETWRRSVFIRLSPAEALPYFELPQESPIGEDGLPRKGRGGILANETIRTAFESHGTEQERKTLIDVNAGITHMHAGAHPSAEGTLQVHGEQAGEQRNFGPTYHRSLCAFGFRWGLSAQLWLLNEVAHTVAQEKTWLQEWEAISGDLTKWMKTDEAILNVSVTE